LARCRGSASSRSDSFLRSPPRLLDAQRGPAECMPVGLRGPRAATWLRTSDGPNSLMDRPAWDGSMRSGRIAPRCLPDARVVLLEGATHFTVAQTSPTRSTPRSRRARARARPTRR
jgi:hypothetical protein